MLLDSLGLPNAQDRVASHAVSGSGANIIYSATFGMARAFHGKGRS